MTSGNEKQAAQVLAVQGSPRKGGNTERVLSRVTGAAAEEGARVEVVQVRDLSLSPCREITACYRTGRCPIKDDMRDLYPKLDAARVVILATPIFFYGPSAQIKMVIDRCQAFWARKYLVKEKKPVPRGRGYVVAVGATQGEKLFDGVQLTATYFFDVLDLDYTDDLLVRGVDDAGEVEDRPDVLERARNLGRQIGAFAAR
jgi:multimeric flavodoxin WrbA